MKIQKTINLDKGKVELLKEKYPEKTFTDIINMGLELLLEDEDPSSIKNIQALILEFNKLKKSYREYKDEVDNRFTSLEAFLK